MYCVMNTLTCEGVESGVLVLSRMNLGGSPGDLKTGESPEPGDSWS